MRLTALRNRKSEGFTLIEVIASLLLMGILAAVLATGSLSIVRGLLLERDASAAEYYAQLAMLRMVKELTLLRSVSSSSSSPPSITFVTRHGSSDATVSIAYDSGTQSITLNNMTLGTGAITLATEITGFSLAYYNNYASTTPALTWTSSSRIIQISITVGTINRTFVNRVTPRNVL
jgi:prepilin-type N-terminal cleavage/methylation domain-containing protein